MLARGDDRVSSATFQDTPSVNLNAKHAAILALANLCAKSGSSLRECGKSKALMDIFVRNFKVHAKVRPETSSEEDNDELIAKLSLLYCMVSKWFSPQIRSFSNVFRIHQICLTR